MGLLAGLAGFFLVLYLFEPSEERPFAVKMGAVTLLMAVWWVTEAVPLAVTALVPVALFPILGIMDGKAVAPIYINHVIFLFVGGFLIAIAMEKWGLSRRVALRIIKLVGTGPQRIVLGYMAATAFLSMWISNTATVVMMVPMALAIIIRLEENFGKDAVRNFSVSLMLGVAYSASLGGVATLIGTPPNLSFSRIFEIAFPMAPGVTFANWFMLGLPLSLFLLFVTWTLLTRILFPAGEEITINRQLIDEEYKRLGPMGFEERAVLAISAITALLWISRQGIPLGPLSIPGWSGLLPYPGYINDGTVAIFMALLLFFIPSGRDGNESLLGVEAFTKLPWHIIILFGGGFALAQGIMETGLSSAMAMKFSGLKESPPAITIMAICGSITMMTELTSNTATTEIVLPVLASVAVAMKTNPLLLMIPATISASFAFMMPVATPPNAIIFGSGRLRIIDMVRAGVFLNIISVITTTITVYFLGMVIFDIEPGLFPDWAR